MSAKQNVRGQWSSRLMFILAASGSAVGLGNIWKFPYITGENGGGAFVLVYLLCIALIGIPIMMSEILLGRRGRQNPINTMHDLSRTEGRGNCRAWALLGWLGVVTGFFILSFYSVIAGWAMAYVPRVLSGEFIGLDASHVATIFTDLVSDPERLLAWHTLFMLMTMGVVARGVKDGLETAVRFLMPALFLLLIVMVYYATQSGYFMEGVRFLFTPDFDKLFYQCNDALVTPCRFTYEPLLIAMGHAFFTLSLGMGAIMIYGSYMPEESSIASSAIMIALLDTVVALLAGLAIFPLVFANGLDIGAGPGLIFQTLPIAFGAMPHGQFYGGLFFILLVLAAWTSAISLIEPGVAWLIENKQVSRMKASLFIGVGVWSLGLTTVFSFNDELKTSFSLMSKEFSSIFHFLEYLTANIMLPLGGLFIAIFAGWYMTQSSSSDELKMDKPSLYYLWLYTVKYIAPLAVTVIFLRSIEVI